MVIVGFADLNISMPKGHHILLKNISVIGAPLDIHFKNEPDVMYQGVSEIFDLVEVGKLRPHIMETIPLDDLMKGLRRISDGNITGKIVVTTATTGRTPTAARRIAHSRCVASKARGR